MVYHNDAFPLHFVHGSFTAISAKAPTLLWDDAQLVVARYDEDVRWLDALPGNQELLLGMAE